MKKTFSSTVAALFLVLTACNLPAQQITGNGKLVTQSRKVVSYSSVTVNGSMDVVFEQGDKNSVDVIADENIQDVITTEVVSGTLLISTKKDFGFSTRNKTEVHIYNSQLKALTINGSGDATGHGKFSFENFNLNINGSGDVKLDASANTLSIEIKGSGDVVMNGIYKNIKSSSRGSGDIKLSGTTQNLEFKSVGSGDLAAFDLLAETVTINTNGSGDAKVNVTKSLNVESHGSGDIAYKGEPASKSVNTSGSGECRKSN